MKLFNKILVANRGEIAIRIIKSAKALGIKTVTVYSEVEADALHVKSGDESYCLGKVELHDTYLNIQKIVDVAVKSKCDAVHPGYGFLAENSLFVKACEKAGITFIGPHTNAMKIMGNKIEAREFVKKIKIPMTEGVTGDVATLLKAGKSIPYPLLIKAAAGGGGKGMRIVHNDKELGNALESTSREAKSYFGDGTVYIEKFIEEPRHIEIQIIGDNHGNVVHLFERECSIQRRYQKIIEESPSPTLTDAVRLKMGEAAVRIGKEIGYNNAGTIEFLVDKGLNFYFLEMNTRVQVEHPVTEMVTGIDIVKEQILIAAGNPLSFKQEDIKQNGHAIECRVYAEDPENNFLPSPGKMTYYKEPSGEGIRIDTGINKATTIESYFDPMISKLIVWGVDREFARNKIITALKDYVIHGIKTNITYLINLLQHKAYVSNNISTKFCEEQKEEMLTIVENAKKSTPFFVPLISYIIYSLNRKDETYKNIWNSIGYWRDLMKFDVEFEGKDISVFINNEKQCDFDFEISGEKYSVHINFMKEGKIVLTINNDVYNTYISTEPTGNAYISCDGNIFRSIRKDILIKEDVFSGSGGSTEDSLQIFSPMPGKVIKINIKEGAAVKKGEILLVVEAMKMENNIIASKDTVVEKVTAKVGDMVDSSKPLIIFEDKK
ncbi:MAG: acetyl-CoA carboxylase biotin carboxylase subunit [Bacteroidota bacterium]